MKGVVALYLFGTGTFAGSDRGFIRRHRGSHSAERDRSSSSALAGLAPVLSVKNQQMLPTGMGHIKAASMEIKLANLRVTHVDDAGA